MSLSTQLTFWQPVAVNFIIDAIYNDNLRGCVIADVMGLGKTWVTIALLLWVSAFVKGCIPRSSLQVILLRSSTNIPS